MAAEFPARFWARVEKSDGCWRWTATKIPRGYGMSWWPDEGPELAHRVSYRLQFGDIPVGMQVLHKCDVRDCVNPDHLFLGTHQDNMDDMVRKGRHYSKTSPEKYARGLRNGAYTKPERIRRGENHPYAILTAELVLAIRRAASEGKKNARIAETFGLNPKTVGTVKRRETWKHI